jgi:hypothetical protein
VSNNKQSSVEQFAIALYEKGLLIGDGDLIQTILDLHKAMHKEEIEDAELRGKEIIIIKQTEHLTPIELPTDEEIKKEMGYDEFDPYDIAYYGGIDYMRNKIQGGNNEQQ